MYVCGCKNVKKWAKHNGKISEQRDAGVRIFTISHIFTIRIIMLVILN